MNRMELHSHTHYSNLRLLDCINRPKDLINRAVNIGLKGIAITDHECLSSHMEVNIFGQELLKEHPDFKVALGNEIYLCENRESGQKYYHFILIAKNKEGHKALRELSSRAWMNSYYDRGMERVVTLYDDLKEITTKYPNSLIATTACLGGELSTLTKEMIIAAKHQVEDEYDRLHREIDRFLFMCVNIFGNDFYIECAPGCSRDQLLVNERLAAISKYYGIKMVIGSDAHYLKKEDRFVHKSYLNSKNGEREIDDFYEYSYLQTEDEVIEHLKQSGYTDDFIELMFENSMEIWDKIENFDLRHKQTIPKVEVKDYPIPYSRQGDYFEEHYPILSSMFTSTDKVERYWVNECVDKLNELDKYNETYLARLEEEARVKRIIGGKLETNMFAYPVTLQHYCDMFWDCGSIVGAGRGSSCSGLNHYLLGITQLDPIKWELPFWRYLNEERTELGDIDIDLCPSKRPVILNEIKKERSRNFKNDIDSLTRKNCGCTLIATFGTEGTRSAILTACRGYRSEDFPDGIDVDTAQFLSSLVPSERGFLWPLKDVVNGNKEKDRKPSATFVNEVAKYAGLLEIMMAIEGLINKRSSHASGVILFDEDPYEFGCFMRTPKGEVITQYDLHMAEAAGMTKYDFLVTEVQDKLAECIRLMQEYNVVDKNLTLKEFYNSYLHPEIIPLDRDECWNALQSGNVINIFQFDSDVGSQAAKKIKPTNILEMADANGLMRLMTSEKGEETPMEKYIRFKNDISEWYKEMSVYGLTEEEMKVVEPYFKSSYGVPPSQEQLMRMLMDENICGFTLAEANAARKVVGKKQMSKIPELREKVLTQAKSPCLGNYIWKCGVGPQMGYSFSVIHALAYSFIGYQTVYIATRWNPIFWNTACLIVNSGSLEDNSEEEIVDIYAPEAEDLANGVTFVDLPDRSGKIRKTASTNYAKMAKAIGDIISKGIEISLVDINKSNFGFKPDIETNQILFGMKGLNKVGDPIIEKIIAGRPYKGIIDFMNRCPLNKTAMISLIKAGAFDELDKEWAGKLNPEPRVAIMAYYLMQASDLKKKLNLQNFNMLLQRDFVPESLNFQKSTFNFNKYIKGFKWKDYYVLDNRAAQFYANNFDVERAEVIDGVPCIKQKEWEKMYKAVMDDARTWLIENEKKILAEVNDLIFKESWEKYAKDNISAWEMESVCFYSHKHELANVDVNKYGIIDFFSLPTEPIVDYYFKRNGKQIPIYKTFKIFGTVISKDDNHSTVTLLTPTGVVTVKFSKEHYAMYKRQISEKNEEGKKEVQEKGWFTRGTKIMVTGFRRDDMFQVKTYKHTPTHSIYKITNIDGKDMTLEHERYGYK